MHSKIIHSNVSSSFTTMFLVDNEFWKVLLTLYQRNEHWLLKPLQRRKKTKGEGLIKTKILETRSVSKNNFIIFTFWI